MKKHWKIATWMVWGALTGCAGADPAPDRAYRQVPYAGTVQIRQLPAQQAEATLDGVRFEGAWQEHRCYTPECRGTFRNVVSVERKHVYRGSADLAAPGATQLHCTWVRLHREFSGACVAEDGRLFRLAMA